MQNHRPRPAVALALAIGFLGACDLAPTAPSLETGPALAASHTPLDAAPTTLYEVTSLGTLSGYWTLGTGINDAGEVAGQLNPDPGGDLHAFLWTPEDGVVDIGPTTGGNFISYAINNAAVVTGYRLVGGNRVAFRWEMGSGFEDLAALDGHTSSRGNAITTPARSRA